MGKVYPIPVTLLLSGALAIPVAGQEAGVGTAPTWVADVGPIMADKCMNCHRPGQIAPMNLLTYEDVRPWAPSIGMMVAESIMPPRHADPQYGVFGNDRRLSDAQVRAIVDWVDAGAPRGQGEFTPPRFAQATDGFLPHGRARPAGLHLPDGGWIPRAPGRPGHQPGDHGPHAP